MGVEPVADGSAKLLVTQLDKTLTTICQVSSELQVARIGWNLITAVMSDQASSQKAKAKMQEERGGDDSEGAGLNEAYRGMQVGVNLRAAEVRGLNRFISENNRNSVGVDLIVHSTCKLLGHLGTNPEYGRGVIGFPEFLKAALEDATTASMESEWLDNMRVAMLERQVGSRYFVTSRNAGRILFLAPHAAKYIHSLEKTKELNNLGRNVLQYMENTLTRPS